MKRLCSWESGGMPPGNILKIQVKKTEFGEISGTKTLGWTSILK